jgi:triacylglycerol lipase
MGDCQAKSRPRHTSRMALRSSLARLQQAAVLLLGSAAAGWLGWHWASAPALGAAGVVAIVFGHSLFLAAEFVALRSVGRSDAVAQPSAAMLARAWAAEVFWDLVVFAWRQPFRWRAIPDHMESAAAGPRPGVVFIHGFICNRGFWNPWLRMAQENRIAFIAVNLEPVFGSIDSYVPIIDDAVRRLTLATGAPPVLVCHSMGGLAARAWLRSAGDPGRVHHVITIGTPHHGTWLARRTRIQNGLQMRSHSPWLRELEDSGIHADLFTCWYSNCDNVVLPASAATLPGADNRFVPGVAHVELAFQPEVIRESLAKAQAGPR